MGPAALWRCRGRKVGEYPAGRARRGEGDARALEQQDSGLRGGAPPSEREESEQRRSGAGGAGRHVREEGGRAPHWLARGARHFSRARLFTSARGCYF